MVNDKCPNECKIKQEDVSFPQDTHQKYYQFAIVTTEYYDKHDKKKPYKRTARVDEEDKIIYFSLMTSKIIIMFCVNK